MRPAIVFCSLALMLVTICSLFNSSTAQTPQKVVAVNDGFAGKIVSIYHRDGDQFSVTLLDHVDVASVGGVVFLSGKSRGFKPEIDEAWKGVDMMIPVKNVETILLFDNLEIAKKLLTTMSRGALKTPK